MIHKCVKGDMPEDIIFNKFHEYDGYLCSPLLYVGNDINNMTEITRRKSTNVIDSFCWAEYNPKYWKEI